MDWIGFTQLRELLMQVNTRLAEHNSKDSNSVKGRALGSLYAVSLVPVLFSLKESDFSDLSYRQIISDAELEKVKNNLNSLNY